MKTFEVVLTKSYVVTIKAENRHLAKEYSELFTGDIHDVSSVKEKKDLGFKIEDIDCKINEGVEVVEVMEVLA
jgi:hypothetical protein